MLAALRVEKDCHCEEPKGDVAISWRIVVFATVVAGDCHGLRPRNDSGDLRLAATDCDR